MTTQSKHYDLESLAAINGYYHHEHGVTASDVEMVNRWINLIEQSRSMTMPKPGDRVIYTSRHGDYCPGAMVEKFANNGWHICECPYVPFVCLWPDGRITCSISGGPFCHIPADGLKYAKAAANMFKDWGHCGACADGGVYFEAQVSVWEYADPDPLYGEFTTRDWDRHYLSELKGEHREVSGYKYKTDNMAFENDEQLSEFLADHNATVFPGHYSNQRVAWCYKERHVDIPQPEWDALELPASSYRTENSRPVKVGRNDKTRLTTFHFHLNNNGVSE